MPKKIIHDGPVNTAVVAWMRGQGIKPSDVHGYTLTYNAGDLMTIDIRMYMEDVAPKPKSANLPECPKPWPSRVRDAEGDEYRHQGGGVYRMVLDETGGLGNADYTLEEIRAVYGGHGQYEVIED